MHKITTLTFSILMACTASVFAETVPSAAGLKLTGQDVAAPQMQPAYPHPAGNYYGSYDAFVREPHILPTLLGVNKGIYVGVLFYPPRAWGFPYEGMGDPAGTKSVRAAFIVSPNKSGPVYAAIDGLPTDNRDQLSSEEFISTVHKAQAALNKKDKETFDKILKSLYGFELKPVSFTHNEETPYAYEGSSNGQNNNFRKKTYLAVTSGINGALKARIEIGRNGQEASGDDKTDLYAGNLMFIPKK